MNLLNEKNTATVIVIAVAVILVLAFVVVGGGSFFLGGTHPDQFVEATCDELAESTTVSKVATAIDGDPLSISLCGDPSTGKRWSTPVIDGQRILEFDYTEFVVGQDTVDVEEAGIGRRRWRYMAVSKGQAILRSEYGIPGAATPEKSFVLTLTVE